MKMIKVTTSGDVSLVEVAKRWDYMAKEIGSRYIQYVRPVEGFGILNQYSIVCDEEGLLADEPVCNPFASLLYGTLGHGQPIMGNILMHVDAYTVKKIDADSSPEKAFELAKHVVKWLRRTGLEQAFHSVFDGKTSEDYPTKVFAINDEGKFVEVKKGE